MKRVSVVRRIAAPVESSLNPTTALANRGSVKVRNSSGEPKTTGSLPARRQKHPIAPARTSSCGRAPSKTAPRVKLTPAGPTRLESERGVGHRATDDGGRVSLLEPNTA